jgi:serine/arginine repetitive matrix protein 2
MYNGIGLSTVRGSGTSGYVMKNQAAIKKHKPMIGNYKEILQQFKDNPLMPKKKPNLEIIEHEKKRKIEVKLYEMAEKLKDEGKTQEEVNEIINNEREIMIKQMNDKVQESIEAAESHMKSQLKDIQMDKLKSAFRVEGDYQLGNAIDI